MSKTVVAIFASYNNAEKAAYEVRDKGLRTDNISIISKSSGKTTYYRSEYEDGSMNMKRDDEVHSLYISKGSAISDGIITGGICGGVAGIIVGAASMFIPGLGLFAAAGPIAGLLIGFVAGGLIGGLINIGIPKNKSREYEQLISNGNSFFSMMVDEDRMEQIVDILKQNGALLIEKYK